MTRSVRQYNRALSVLACSTLGSATTALALSTQPLPLQQRATPALAVTGVTVIDITDGRLVPRQTVIVLGNRIHAIGPTATVRPPAGAQVVNARGKYLIPGLWDMHTHVDDHVEWYPRFLAHGVTGIREMVQRFKDGPDSFRVWQREVATGTRVGPRSWGLSAEIGNGISEPKTPEQMAHLVDSLKTAGIAFIKFHDNGPYFDLLREARRVGLPVVGHVPEFKVNAVQAADSGQRSIEHITENYPCDGPQYGVFRTNPARVSLIKASVHAFIPKQNDTDTLSDSTAWAKGCEAVVAAYLRNGTWFTPTLVIFRVRGEFGPSMKIAMHTMRQLGFKRFLAGTDVNSRHYRRGLWPGVSIQQELGLLTQSGLTALEALQAATLHPAQFFKATDSLGTVAPGKLADLVLLDANPLADIMNVAKIRSVVANGRYFDRATLDTFDPAGIQFARTQLKDGGFPVGGGAGKKAPSGGVPIR